MCYQYMLLAEFNYEVFELMQAEYCLIFASIHFLSLGYSAVDQASYHETYC